MVDELVFVIIIACSTTFTNGVDQSLTIITSTGGARARWNLWMMVGHAWSPYHRSPHYRFEKVFLNYHSWTATMYLPPTAIAIKKSV